jgi:hypothetical protein
MRRSFDLLAQLRYAAFKVRKIFEEIQKQCTHAIGKIVIRISEMSPNIRVKAASSDSHR